ncbi:MAG: prepilin-type N-terminal cleavage/methylation domain-containing protein [Gemmatimonadales bacterium]|nr:MAG: prepilin-type N-terminal cleavage/methylation domain-containing protein [Gemmatimonadales bacterium]
MKTSCPATRRRRGVRGFTLIELLVVIVLSAIVMGAIIQILLSNQRLYTANTEQVLAQQTVRSGVEVVAQELREISSELGDVLSASATQVQIRAVRKMGVVCAVDSRAPLTVRIGVRGRPFEAGEAVTFFVDNDVDIAGDDEWATATITTVDAGMLCPNAVTPALSLVLASVAPTTATTGVHAGSMIRAFESFTYGQVTWDSEPYLGRVPASGTGVPLVGPVDATNGIRFVYRNAAGATTSTLTEIRTIELTLRSTSGARTSTGRMVADSLTRVIHLRN